MYLLQCSLESDGVFWDLDDDLGSLLCVDMKKFNQILVENGLKSLGLLEFLLKFRNLLIIYLYCTSYLQ